MSSIFTTRGDDQIARGAADRLRETGLRVPEDVALVGFDNWGVIATACRPPLTTVDMNLRQLSRAAGEHLLAAVDGRPGSGLQLLPCGLVIRESSRPAVVAPSMTPVNEGTGRALRDGRGLAGLFAARGSGTLGEQLGEFADFSAHGGELVDEQTTGRERVSGDGVDGGVEDGVSRYLQVAGVQFG